MRHSVPIGGVDMTWARLDDGFWCHPKVALVSDASLGTWTRTLSWCAKYATDGKIPDRLKAELRIAPEAASELVESGLWEMTEQGWQIHDYLEFNPSKVEMAEHKAADRSRKRNARAAVADRRSRVDTGETVYVCPPGQTPAVHTLPIPIPIPIPDPGEDLKTKSEISERAREASEQVHRFRAPLPEAPPDVAPSLSPALRVWRLYVQEARLDPIRFPVPGAQLAACQAIATYGGQTHDDQWDRAVQSLLRAWLADPWVAEKKPMLSNLEKNLVRYAERADAKRQSSNVTKTTPKPPTPEQLKEEADRAEHLKRTMALLAEHALTYSDQRPAASGEDNVSRHLPAQSRQADLGSAADARSDRRALLAWNASSAEGKRDLEALGLRPRSVEPLDRRGEGPTQRMVG